ncbi:MAG: hypothetical protein ABJI96_10210 [Paracoccaceae bacterium]
MAAALAGQVNADPIDRFVGVYSGAVEVEIDGKMIQRDASVEIEADSPGFIVNWTTATRRSDGSIKEKSYTVVFRPSERKGVFGAAMRKNVFGKEVPLDPMKGEPYVWSRIVGDTLSVFSIYVYDDGSYEIQQFDRTLVEGGLNLEFSSAKNGEVRRQLSAFLARES